MSLAIIHDELTDETSTDVAEFLRLLHPEGTFEVRIPNTHNLTGTGKRKTASGFFSDRGAAAREVVQWSEASPKGIYVTLNPVVLDPTDTIRFGATEAAKDKDVMLRRWLLIDIDPVRPGSVSATDQERDEAIEVAEHVRDWLADRDWPEPLQMMSGNGSYLLYRVDLPNHEDANEMVKRCLNAISDEFSGESVTIDTSVANASRVAKVAGTWSRKGESTEDRPHRQAYFHVPAGPIEVVRRDSIEAIAERSEPEATLTPADIDLNDVSPERIAQRRERCQAYLAEMKSAVSGKRGHNKILEAACSIGRFGLNEEHGSDLLFEYNDDCDPPFDEKDVKRKLSEGLKKVLKDGQFGKFVRGDEDVKADPKPEPIKPISFGELMEKYPTLDEPVIHGLLRKGETMNIIASTKAGKSFLAGGLALSIAAGVPWLGHDVEQGRVAIIDNELKPRTISYRLRQIANEMSINHSVLQNAVDAYAVRGKGIDIHSFDHALEAIQSGNYQLVILDALYRTLPSGTSENDNAAMMAIYNKLDHYAAQWDCSIAVVHHSSKGNQSDKSITDVGSGAGAISRAADTHLTIRPHSDPELSVLECVTRSFKSPEPTSVRYEFPVWTKVDAEPVLQARKTAADTKQAAADNEAEQVVLAILESELESGEGWLSAAKIRRKSNFGQGRVDRALARLADVLEVKEVPHPRNSEEEVEVFRLASQEG